MLSRSLALCTLLLAAGAAMAEENLGPGSAAPELSIKKWLKGKPVLKLEPKKTYVVEFWATWCGPCIDSIPHVTKLAKANKDVTFIGVGIWEEEEGDKIPKFVASMGSKMDYNVGYSGNRDGMAASWMAAASQRGIPTAFIVKDQKVMWIGHPMEMDKPLAEIKAGTFDMNTFKARFDKQAQANRKEMARQKEFTDILDLHTAGKKDEAKKALGAFVAKNPDYASTAERVEFDWLADENPEAWLEKTKGLIAGGKEEELMKLASFALSRAQKPEGAEKARLAMSMALKASPKDNYMLYVYARTVYLKLEDTKEALEATNKMIEMLPNSPAKDRPEVKDSLLKSKAELEAKLAKKGGSF